MIKKGMKILLLSYWHTLEIGTVKQRKMIIL